MAAVHAGMLEDGCVYTHAMLAKLLDQSEGAVKELIQSEQIHHKRVGKLLLVSGRSFRGWVECEAEPSGAGGVQPLSEKRKTE